MNSSLCIHDARNFDEYTQVLAGKEETPKCRKKTVTWTNEMIEDLIDFIEIHPIVAFEAIYEPMLTSFWTLISFAVQLYIIMQYKGQHPPLLPKNAILFIVSPAKTCVSSSKFLASCIHKLEFNIVENDVKHHKP